MCLLQEVHAESALSDTASDSERKPVVDDILVEFQIFSDLFAVYLELAHH